MLAELFQTKQTASRIFFGLDNALFMLKLSFY